jgi:hypothetical protein
VRGSHFTLNSGGSGPYLAALGSGHVPRKRTYFHTEGLKLAAGQAGGVVSGEQGPLHASASGRCLT